MAAATASGLGAAELADELDLSGFEAGYRADGQGSRPYHPAMMVTLVMYCYCKGIRSSRGIEIATFDDVGALVICGNLHPDHATTARFAARHEQELKGLLAASWRRARGRAWSAWTWWPGTGRR